MPYRNQTRQTPLSALLSMSSVSAQVHAKEVVGVGMEEEKVVLPVPADRLRKWNIGMGIFHLIFGIIALAIGKRDLRVPVYGSTLGLETMVNNTRAWAYKPQNPQREGWLYLTMLVFSFSFLSAIAHLGNAFLWRTLYVQGLQSGYAPARWIEYSMSASVMILILSYISGTVFESTLILLFTLTMITMVFGHLHEVICRPKSLKEWAGSSLLWRLQAHLFGYIPQLFAWGIVISNFMAASTASKIDERGEERKMPTFVYAIVFGEMLIFWSFGLVQLVVTLRPPSRYCEGEIAYMWLSLFAKGFLCLLCLANVIMAGGYAEIYEDMAGDPTTTGS